MGGVIDAGFRGEFTISLFNVGPNTQTIKAGQKIVQMLIQKFEDCDIVEVESLSETVRGEGREGSTGQI
jgi:dUTP pyrophosphatase